MSGQGQSIKTNINYNSNSSTEIIDNKYILLNSTNNGIYIQNTNSITDIFAIIWANTTSYKLINNELFNSFSNITTLLNNDFTILKFSPTSISTNFTMFENIEATKEIRLYELFILTDNTKNTEIETYLLNKYNQNLHTYINFDSMTNVSEYLLFHNILNSFSYMSVGVNNDKSLKAINISDNSKSYPNSNLSYFATENNNINILSVPKIAPVNTDKLEICGFQNGILKPVINISNNINNSNIDKIDCNILSNLKVSNADILMQDGGSGDTGIIHMTSNEMIIGKQDYHNSIRIRTDQSWTRFMRDDNEILCLSKDDVLIKKQTSIESGNLTLTAGDINFQTTENFGDNNRKIRWSAQNGQNTCAYIYYNGLDSETLSICAHGSLGNIQFKTANGADTETTRMTITKDGKVGIGTTDPTEKLHISEGDVLIENQAHSVLKVKSHGYHASPSINFAHNYWDGDEGTDGDTSGITSGHKAYCNIIMNSGVDAGQESDRAKVIFNTNLHHGYTFRSSGTITDNLLTVEGSAKIESIDGFNGKLELKERLQITNGPVIIGGQFQNTTALASVANAYEDVSQTRLYFGGLQANHYYIGTDKTDETSNPLGGINNFTRLTLRWHTGIRIGAHKQYGGVRLYNDDNVDAHANLCVSIGYKNDNTILHKGYLGIGTTSPERALHISGSTASQTRIRIQTTTTENPVLEFQDASNNLVYLYKVGTQNKLYLTGGLDLEGVLNVTSNTTTLNQLNLVNRYTEESYQGPVSIFARSSGDVQITAGGSYKSTNLILGPEYSAAPTFCKIVLYPNNYYSWGGQTILEHSFTGQDFTSGSGHGMCRLYYYPRLLKGSPTGIIDSEGKITNTKVPLTETICEFRLQSGSDGTNRKITLRSDTTIVDNEFQCQRTFFPRCQSGSTGGVNFVYGTDAHATSGGHKWKIDMGSSGDLHFKYIDGNISGEPTVMRGYLNHTNANTAMNFTGQHRCIPQEKELYDNIDNYVGMIVEATGEYNSIFTEKEEYDFELIDKIPEEIDKETNTIINEEIIIKKEIIRRKKTVMITVNEPTINEAQPIVKLTTTKKSKKVYGVISSKEDGEHRVFQQGIFASDLGKRNDNRLFINSVGEGGILVNNENGNIENGDLLMSSSTTGIACKQDDDIVRNYTIGKATMDYNFTSNENKLIGCCYYCG